MPEKVPSITGSRSPLVKLRSKGSQEPLFLIHGATGLVSPYRELVRRLEKDRPVYGLQHPGIEDRCEPYTSITAMASYYYDLIRSIQPMGPYFLGGWSFGGAAAVEIARTLFHHGQEIRLLCLFDALEPGLIPNYSNATFLAALVYMLGKKFKLDHQAIAAPLHLLPGEKLMDYLLNRLKKELKEKGVPQRFIDKLAKIFEVYKVCIRASKNHKTGEYPGQIVLFQAKDGSEEKVDPAYGWQRFSPQPVITHLIPGNHFTIMEIPNIQILANKLHPYLQEKTSWDRYGIA